MEEELSVEAGQRIGNYVIEARIGKGAEGNVFLARDLLLGRRVALKTPRSGRAGETHGMEEARTMARLEHPHIVRVYHADRYRGVWFIAYEYVEGGTVHEWVQQAGAVSVERALEVTLQAARGLACAHEHGILHRDIKPHNLMMSGHGHVKIGDFGLALDVQSPNATSLPPVGTPAFLAPELWAGQAPSVASDVYSLGGCLYYLLLGRAPFHVSDVDKLRRAHLELEPKIGPRVPRGVRDLLLSMLAKNPEVRPATDGSLIPALCQLAGNPRHSSVAVQSYAANRSETGPFVDEGAARGLQAVLSHGVDRVGYQALLRSLRLRLPLVTLRTGRVPDARLLLSAAVSAFAPTYAFASRVALQHGDQTVDVALSRALALGTTESFDALCTRLRRGHAPPEGVGIVEIYSPEGLRQHQWRSVQSLADAARDSGLCMVHIIGDPALVDGVAAAGASTDGEEVVLSGDKISFEDYFSQLRSWVKEATGSRFFFSADGARALRHLSEKEARPWTELAHGSVLVAAATKNRVVTSWAVLAAYGYRRPLRDVHDVQEAAARKPSRWPTADVARFLHNLRTTNRTGERLPPPRPLPEWPLPAADRGQSSPPAKSGTQAGQRA